MFYQVKWKASEKKGIQGTKQGICKTVLARSWEWDGCWQDRAVRMPAPDGRHLGKRRHTNDQPFRAGIGMQCLCFFFFHNARQFLFALWNSSIGKTWAVEKRNSFSFRLHEVWYHQIVGFQNIIWLNHIAVYNSRTVQLMKSIVALLEKCSVYFSFEETFIGMLDF